QGPAAAQSHPDVRRAIGIYLGHRNAQQQTGLTGQLFGGWGFWDKHPLLAKVLMYAAPAAPLAAFALPALAGSAGGGGAGATGAALGPSTPTSMAGTAAIAGGSTVPASLAAVTPAELAAAGGAGG